MEEGSMFKKFSLLILLLCAHTSNLYSDDVGVAACEASDDATSSDWRNWIFAGSALVTFVLGVVIISTNTGTFSHE
jgi:hypothetical protein